MAAETAADFVVVDGKSLPSEETEAKVLFDDSNLYVAFVCHRSSDRELRTLAQPPPGGTRDAVGDVWLDDAIELFLDSAGLGETYFQFIVNSRGACLDLKGLDPGWDGVYEVATRVEPTQWTVEMAIPFAALEGGQRGAATAWGVNFCRDLGVGEQGEPSSWFPVPLSFQSAAHLGRLTGLAPDPEGLAVAMHVEPPAITWVGANPITVRLSHRGEMPFAGHLVLDARDSAGGTQEQRLAVRLDPGGDIELTPEVRLEERVTSRYTVRLVSDSDRHLAAVTPLLSLSAPELFVFRVVQPSYRATVFPSMGQMRVVFEARVGLEPDAREDCTAAATVWDSLGDRKIEVAPVAVTGSAARLSMPVADLAPDSYRVFGRLQDAGGGTMAVRETAFTVLALPEEGREVWVDDEGRLCIDGTPFFPVMTSHAFGADVMGRMNARLAEDGLPPMDEQRICEALCELGLNAVQGPPHDRRYLDLARDAGLYVISEQITGFDTPLERIATSVHRLRGHPALLAYYGIDEVTQVRRRQSREAGIVVRALDPYHPYLTSLCVPSEAGWLSEEHDILMPDSYPVDTHPLTQVASMMDATRACLRRPAPLWFFVQGWAHTGRMPTDAEIRVMAYLALNHGARGLNLFSFCNRFRQAPDKGALTGFARDPFWAGWRRVARETRALADVWLAPGSARRIVSADRPFVDLLAKLVDGSLTVVAVNPTARPSEVEFRLPDGAWSAAGEVVFAGRSVTQADGAFTDRLDRHDVHVYRFRPPPKRDSTGQ